MTTITGGQAHVKDTPAYPMQLLKGMVVAKPNRRAPTCDVDTTPIQFRRYVGASGVHEVQLRNGLWHRVGAGKRTAYRGTHYLFNVAPLIPGQTRQDAAGYHKRGPDPLSIAAMKQAGPGSQPANPGGPGKIAGSLFINPMTG